MQIMLVSASVRWERVRGDRLGGAFGMAQVPIPENLADAVRKQSKRASVPDMQAG